MVLFSPRPLARALSIPLLIFWTIRSNLPAWSGGIIPEDQMKEHSRKIRSLAVNAMVPPSALDDLVRSHVLRGYSPTTRTGL